jgi:hypothetical protein
LGRGKPQVFGCEISFSSKSLGKGSGLSTAPSFISVPMTAGFALIPYYFFLWLRFPFSVHPKPCFHDYCSLLFDFVLDFWLQNVGENLNKILPYTINQPSCRAKISLLKFI